MKSAKSGQSKKSNAKSIKSRKSLRSFKSKLTNRLSTHAESKEPKPEPIDLSYQEVNHNDNLTPNDLYKLRHYLEKKEKKGQNPEGKWGRKPRNANDDLQDMSRDGSNERMKTTKGDGNAIKFQKEISHCLEENRYVMPRKIQIDKLPDHVKELLRV